MLHRFATNSWVLRGSRGLTAKWCRAGASTVMDPEGSRDSACLLAQRLHCTKEKSTAKR